MACVGKTAPTTAGCFRIPFNPSTAIVANQTSMTGPNTPPTPVVPRLWNMKRPTRMTSVIQITQGCRWGAAISRPSTAESTETAGVSAPSA